MEAIELDRYAPTHEDWAEMHEWRAQCELADAARLEANWIGFEDDCGIDNVPQNDPNAAVRDWAFSTNFT